jgi:hypothetical protein
MCEDAVTSSAAQPLYLFFTNEPSQLPLVVQQNMNTAVQVLLNPLQLSSQRFVPLAEIL